MGRSSKCWWYTFEEFPLIIVHCLGWKYNDPWPLDEKISPIGAICVNIRKISQIQRQMFKSGLQHTRPFLKCPCFPLLHPIYSMTYAFKYQTNKQTNKQTNRKYERRCVKVWAKTTMIRFTYGWWKKSCSSWYGKYWVLYVPGGAGSLPSTVYLGMPAPTLELSRVREVWRSGWGKLSSRSCLLLFFLSSIFHLKFVSQVLSWHLFWDEKTTQHRKTWKIRKISLQVHCVFLKTQADLGGVVNWTGGDDQLVLDYVPRS